MVAEIMKFENAFGSKGNEQPKGKFLSRFFGIFSEEIIRIWARDKRCKYIDLGRPTIINPEKGTRFTIDFCLQNKSTGLSYASEMKCEIEYQDYKYFILNSPNQLVHHNKEAFKEFLTITKSPKSRTITIRGTEKEISGGILIWGAGTENGFSETKEYFGFNDVIFVSDVIRDLIEWKNQEYLNLIYQYRNWVNQFSSDLTSTND